MPADFFSTEHRHCLDIHNQELETLRTLSRNACLSDFDLSAHHQLWQKMAKEHFVSEHELKNIIIESWEAIVSEILNGRLPHLSEVRRLERFALHHELSTEHLNLNGSFTRLQRVPALQRVLHGKAPEYGDFPLNIPFRLQANEILLWSCKNTPVYLLHNPDALHTGNRFSPRALESGYAPWALFSGSKAPIEHAKHIDTGMVACTSQAVYFQGKSKKFRLDLKDLHRLTPFEDSIALQKEGSMHMPVLIQSGEGWFHWNIINNALNVHYQKPQSFSHSPFGKNSENSDLFK
jgi:hypothetical protein